MGYVGNMHKKIFYHLPLCLLAPIAASTQFPPGILGGQSNGAPWAAFLDQKGNLQPISSTLLPPGGNILSVDINNLGQAIIGGFDNNLNAYAALTNEPNHIINIAGLPANSEVNCVAINNANQAILITGGISTVGTFYAASIALDGTPTTYYDVTAYAADGYAATINDQGYSLFGGRPTTFYAYGFIVDPQGNIDVFHQGPPPGFYRTASMNSSGVTVTGGGDGLAYGSWASFVYTDGTETPLPVSGDPLPSPLSSQILSVSINNSGDAIIGGYNNIGPTPYAALVTPAGQVTNLPVSGDPLPSLGKILSVATNEAGLSLIGGYDGSSAYAAFVSSSGNITNLSMPSTGVINAVAITAQGAGLVGGQNGSAAYAALISPLGQIIALNGLPSMGSISSIALGTFFSQIPTQSLTGNNKRFAKYINRYAPEDIFYFIPSYLDGTLSKALESAAPTRNALSLFSVDNNLFFLNTGLSTYLRGHRYVTSDSHKESSVAFLEDFCENKGCFDKEIMIASNSDSEWLIANQTQKPLQDPKKVNPLSSSRPYTLWGEGLGALASQKAQHQTPGFEPSSIGFILGLDRSIGKYLRTGGCFSTLFTHVHEKENAGFSRTAQELLCLYATGSYHQFYADLALWTGLFQTYQKRNIEMTGFHFKASSHPGGVQLAPHLELGYDWKIQQKIPSAWQFIINPFLTTDWVTAWQERFKERGNGPFNAEQRPITASFLRIETGIRAYETIGFTTWSLGLEQKGSYVYRNPFELGTINAFLVGSPGSFMVDTLSAKESLGVFGLACFFKSAYRQYPYGSLSYQGEFNKQYRSNQLTLEISWNF